MECPERDRRAALTNEEFWDEVLNVSLEFEGPMIEAESDTEMVSIDGAACTTCDSTGPCAYDAEGRPLIHVDSQEIGE